MDYKIVLFDADATLLDFEKTEDEALKNTFLKYGLILTEEIKAQYGRINHGLWSDFEKGLIDKQTVVQTRFKRLFEELGVEIEGGDFEKSYQSALADGSFLIEDAIEVCTELHKTKDLYIVTNGVSSTQYKRLRESGLDQFMKGVFVSEEVGYQKPRREYFDYVFERIPNLNLEKTIIIGDSLASDIKGGNNAGIDTCWFNPKGGTCDADVQITYEIKDLKELLDLGKK